MKADIDEALRYLGVRRPDETLRLQMQRIADELSETLQPRYSWRVFSLQQTAEGWLVPELALRISGRSADRMLQTSHHLIILAATLGSAFDAKLRELQHRSMAQAVMTDACGSAFIEAVCNQAEQEIAARLPEQYLTDRFSPGYGDLPLALQSALLAAVDAERRTGITLLESQLMNPSKSVTALIGVSDQPQQARIRGCAYCQLAADCMLRKRGVSCGS